MMVVNKFEKIPSESHLLEAYQLLVEDLDYESIEKCTDVSTLVKILRVLRSAQVGYYPNLIEFTEARIKFLNPQHIILTKEGNVWSREELGPSGGILQKELSDFCNWTFTSDDEFLPELISSDENDFCEFPIRGQNLNKQELIEGENVDRMNESQIECPTDSENRIKSSDFAGWEKYDVKAELLKLEGENCSDADRARSSHARLHLSEFIPCHEMSTNEKSNVALHEKEKGNEAYRAGDYEEAVTYFNRSLSLMTSTTVINNRAQTYVKMKLLNEAVSDIRYVLTIEPDNLKALLRLGTIYLEQKNYILAEIIFKKALKISPNSKLAARMLQRIAHFSHSQQETWLPNSRKKGPLIEIIE